MSTSTKTNKVNKKVLSIDHDDDNENYDEFVEYIEEHTNRTKNFFHKQLLSAGDTLLIEKERKNSRNEEKKKKLIPKILKKDKDDIYTHEELMSYSYEDNLNILKEIKEKNKGFFVKIFKFLFNT